jgi:5'-nucleotidase/UDP-sugar diphosphatase
MLRKLLFLLALAAPLSAQTVTLLHISDYHSHALPFYTDEGERGGIARAIRYLRQEKQKGALVFCGGDTINKGAPAWSDKFQCVEWPWWNGIVSAMAFGNHDADYGLAQYRTCRDVVRYPILSANTEGFQKYAVFETKGVRIGVFAVAGADFPQLVKIPELVFTDSVAAAREVVQTLRDKERVDAVVMIGHEHQEADYALARAVPGIDVIFGSHSHLKRDLTKIPETETWFISPFQYLTYISRIELTIANHRVASVRGKLVPVDASMPEDRTIARRVRALQRELENDPQYSALFTTIATLAQPMSVDALSKFTLETMRSVTGSDVALSTMSSFRGSLDQGTLTMEELRAALPYDNEIVTCSMPGVQLQRVLDFDEATFVAGVPPVDPEKTYRVATTDYQAFVAYKDVFTCEKTRTGLRVRDEVKKRLGSR